MIKSDNWIRQMCQTPTHAFLKANGVFELISEPFSPHQKRVQAATAARQALLSCTVMGNEERENKKLFDPLIESIHSLDTSDTVNTIVMDGPNDINVYFDGMNAQSGWKPMIEPFLPEAVKTCEKGHRAISSGVSSYGYDVRLSSDLRIFTNINSMMIDPYEIDEKCYVSAEIHLDELCRQYAILPPNSFMLGHTIEYFRIPSDVLVVAVGKSTWARAGVSVIITPIEPGFEGDVVIEIANHTNLPIKIYTEVGISQFLFFQSDERCTTSYADRSGKYQGQTGITMPKV